MTDFFANRYMVFFPSVPERAMRKTADECGNHMYAVSPPLFMTYCLSLTLPKAFNSLSDRDTSDRSALHDGLSRMKSSAKPASRHLQLTAQQSTQTQAIATAMGVNPTLVLAQLICQGYGIVAGELGPKPQQREYDALRRKVLAYHG